ncbi:hypothetical protein [Micromonospora pattaloongensis]|uniref:hypothetical protein n=1 Tax=Micromonospora pattaloongensis TaxID=405436 RepID=UPI000B84F62E|nr:hypothetical protein [Micromonospora pattaloongensis]
MSAWILAGVALWQGWPALQWVLTGVALLLLVGPLWRDRSNDPRPETDSIEKRLRWYPSWW